MSNKIELCKKIKNNITKLSILELEEIFKILYKNNSNYTKNNNGIFINLNWLDEEILITIDNYINFCFKSHNEINKYENICTILNNSINNKNKEEQNLIENNIDNKNIKQKISSSMKFYLLKKKFLKQNTCVNVNSFSNELTYEEYLF
jgi:hypothetical protein